MTNRYAFIGGDTGSWEIQSIRGVRGDSLPPAARLAVVAGGMEAAGAAWTLQGFTSNLRYATHGEVDLLKARQQGLGRPEATLAALIPIRKTAAWWDLAQDDRRALFEETSQHTRIGLDYLPAVARRLHHCRDLGEPFDFLTWFEYAPEHGPAFEELVARLRATREWEFVDHEVDVRLIRR